MTAAWKPRTLILQHEEATPPGLMTTWLHEQSARVETVRIDEDDRALDPRAAGRWGRRGDRRRAAGVRLGAQPRLAVPSRGDAGDHGGVGARLPARAPRRRRRPGGIAGRDPATSR